VAFSVEGLKGLEEVVRITAQQHGDARGWFAEVFKRSDFAAHGLVTDWLQQNHASSGPRGTLRGLHFQVAPAAQAKLVRCVHGAIFDVAVDLRPGSPTFGRWASLELEAPGLAMLYVPVGFAHGYQTLTDSAEVLYATSSEYAPSQERGLRWNDPDVGVRWPRGEPILSDRDAALPLLRSLDLRGAWA
jgi:dTDP-4-dehydrorhamnose 3,5-epimerase